MKVVTEVAYPMRLSERFGTDRLRQQFVLARDAELMPSGWRSVGCAGWLLGTDVLPVVDVLTGAERIGWLIGYPITPDGRLLTPSTPLQLGEHAAPGAVEAGVTDLAGHYAAFVVRSPSPAVYLDPAGSLAAVYSPAHRMVAASPALVPYTHGADDAEGLIEALAIPRQTNWYPFGLTPRLGVFRLLPNHRLELNTFSLSRHWPTHEISTQDAHTAVEEVGNAISRNIGAVARAHRPYLSLTAGYDSRLLLSCAREHLEKIDFITVDIDQLSRPDVQIGRKLAAQFGLEHRVLDGRAAPPEKVDLWMYRTGCCVADRGTRSLTAYEQLDMDRPHLPGMVGELAKAFYWLNDDRPETRLEPMDLMRRMRLPFAFGRIDGAAGHELVEAARRWWDAAPTDNTLIKLDLMMIEIRLGCWGGPLLYGEYPFRIYPLADRRAIRAMLELPIEYKRQCRLHEDIIAARWPELLGLPFNRPTGLAAVDWAARNYANRSLHRLRRVAGKTLRLIRPRRA